MSLHDDLFNDAAAYAHEENHGTSATLVIYGGASEAVTVIWEPGRIMEDYYPNSESEVAAGVCAIRSNAVSGWTPDTRDKVTIGSATYAVAQIAKLAPMVELQLVDYTRRRAGGGHTLREAR